MPTAQQICSVVGGTPCWRAFWWGCVPTVNCRNLLWGGGASWIPGVRRSLALGIPSRGGIWPTAFSPEAGFGLRHSRALAAGAPESKPLCCAQPFLLPIQSLMQTSLQRSCPGTKKRMIYIIRRFAFERKTGFEPAALSLGS